ncbi:hypothetical protein CLOSPO_01086 [Clostridium sporogenes ATCC 15579]|nr:hypothetical protein CLOSPO_01086 [Clostridium sporogenes ATCC 15579]
MLILCLIFKDHIASATFISYQICCSLSRTFFQICFFYLLLCFSDMYHYSIFNYYNDMILSIYIKLIAFFFYFLHITPFFLYRYTWLCCCNYKNYFLYITYIIIFIYYFLKYKHYIIIG